MRHWSRSYWLLFLWQLIPISRSLPVLMFFAGLVSVGSVVGFGFLLPDARGATLTFLATAAPVLAIVTVGLVNVPQDVASMKVRGTFDYVWSLPFPRLAHLAASLTVALVTALPGVLLAVLTASWRFNVTFAVGPATVAALALASLTAASVGYAIAYASPSPNLTNLATQLIIFGAFLFSPIAFPIERLPSALAALHRVLPVKYMADVVRGSLVGTPMRAMLPALAVLAVWCTGSLCVTYAIVRRPR